MSIQSMTLRCEHFSVSNVVSARCYQCGDLSPADRSTGNTALITTSYVDWEFK